MKIRNGFVGNSSSSSFLIGAARVIDLTAATKIVNDLPNDVEIIPLNWEAFKKREGPLVNPSTLLRDSLEVLRTGSGAEITLKSFNYTEVSIKVTHEDTHIVCAYMTEGDDSDFTVYDENGEYSHMDYGIGLDYFSDNEEAQDILELFNDKDIVAGSDIGYGADRDG